MKIFSVRKGFQADHSSTSYEFYAVDRPLDEKARAAVARLSSRASPSSRSVSFIYHGDWNDLPGGWEPLMLKYYDVMYSESYDWWTLAMAFNTDSKMVKALRQYEFYGVDDLGVRVETKQGRTVLSMHCRMDASMLPDPLEGLLDLLRQNRNYLKKGDHRLLYGIWEEYGQEEDDEPAPPRPRGMKRLPKAMGELLAMIAQG